MKKIFKDLMPIIVSVIICVLLVSLFLGGAFKTKEMMIVTSSTLTKMLEAADLSTAEYIYNGVAQAFIQGREEELYISYKAVVKYTVDFSQITFDIDEATKTVKPAFPEPTFVVDLLEEEGFKYYPKKADIHMKDVYIICENDVLQAAGDNEALKHVAEENLRNTIKALYEPILSTAGYTLMLE